MTWTNLYEGLQRHAAASPSSDVEMEEPKIDIIEERSALVEQVGELAIKREQHIPQWFLDQLNDERFDSLHHPAGEFHKICSVPEAVVNHWKRQGFDIHQATIPEIIARLKRDGLDKFIATSKRIG